MKIAKPTSGDLEAVVMILNALDAIACPFDPYMPGAIQRGGEDEDAERFSMASASQCRRVLEHLILLGTNGALARVVFGMIMLLAPENKVVDQSARTIEHHPDRVAADALKVARPLAEYHEDMGPVTWWKFPIDEPGWIGCPLATDWPGYHTHFTPHPPIPEQPKS